MSEPALSAHIDESPPIPPGGGLIDLSGTAQWHEYVAIADRVAREMPQPVLDWGTGCGQLTHLLRERGVEVTAFDWSPTATSADELISLPDFPDVQAHHSCEPVKLPFPDDNFNCVLSCGVLEHVHQPGASLDELHRVLRPGGRLLIYKLANRFSYLELIARRMGLYYHGAAPNDCVYTRRTSTELLSQHSFRVDAFRRTNLLPLTVKRPPAKSYAGSIWAVNRALGNVPGLGLLATNLELDATALS